MQRSASRREAELEMLLRAALTHRDYALDVARRFGVVAKERATELRRLSWAADLASDEVAARIVKEVLLLLPCERAADCGALPPVWRLRGLLLLLAQGTPAARPAAEEPALDLAALGAALAAAGAAEALLLAAPDEAQLLAAPDEALAAPDEAQLLAPPDEALLAAPDEAQLALPDEAQLAPPDEAQPAPPDEAQLLTKRHAPQAAGAPWKRLRRAARARREPLLIPINLTSAPA